MNTLKHIFNKAGERGIIKESMPSTMSVTFSIPSCEEKKDITTDARSPLHSKRYSPCVCRFGLFVPSPGQRHSSSTGQDFSRFRLAPLCFIDPRLFSLKGGGFRPLHQFPRVFFVLRVKAKFE